MNYKYFVDKVLYNNIVLDENLLILEKLYSIFIIRELERIIVSIFDIKLYWSEE